MNQYLPENTELMVRAPDFALTTLLTMNDDHYINKVWPLAFYISRKKAAKWQMNAARALGNLGDRDNISALISTLTESPHDIVRGMSAWALGRLGGAPAKKALEAARSREEGIVKAEIEAAFRSLTKVLRGR